MTTNKLNFRAWCKSDFTTPDGPLKFSLQEVDDELYFTMDEDPSIMYKFYIPFIDREGWIVEQSTGRKDQNEIEIFEGDIVRTTDNDPLAQCSLSWEKYTNATITWLRESWNLCQYYLGSNEMGNYFFCDCCSCLEILGNIHQHPELETKRSKEIDDKNNKDIQNLFKNSNILIDKDI